MESPFAYKFAAGYIPERCVEKLRTLCGKADHMLLMFFPNIIEISRTAPTAVLGQCNMQLKQSTNNYRTHNCP